MLSCLVSRSEVLFLLYPFLVVHYENTPMQYTAIFHGNKNDFVLDKKLINFLIFAQNIDCGYPLELPQCGGSNEYPQSMFLAKNKLCIPL